MTARTNEQLLIDSFASVAESLVEGYDTVELLQRLVESCQYLDDVDQAAILLIDEFGELDVVASTSESSRLLELLQIGAHSGPCVECVRTGRPVTVDDIADGPEHWADFSRGAAEHGFGSVSALPLRVRETVIGSLNLFRSRAGAIGSEFLRTAQALADIATVSVLHERTLRESAAVSEQLRHALTSRIVIEQAKGVLAHTHGIDMDSAFRALRGYAREHSVPLAEVSARVVGLELSIDAPKRTPRAGGPASETSV
jgi:GAF domain-containing protein